MITFAAFHMDIGKDNLAGIHQIVSTITVKEEPRLYLETALASCRARHPGCRRVVLTDSSTPFPADAGYEVFRVDGLDPARLMFSRSHAWTRFLERADSHVVYLDGDMLIQEDLEPLFEREFDAGLTYRDGVPNWPINAGIQFFHRRRLDRGVAFLRDCLRLFETRYQASAAWGGDQDALRDMIVGADVSRTDTHLWRSTEGYDLLLLPCARYNFSTQAEKMPGPYPGIPVLHFKGKRKDDMLPYWRQHLAQKSGDQQ